MADVLGIPTDLLFAAVGGLGVYVFFEEKRNNRDKFIQVNGRIDKLEDSKKELSREELRDIHDFVKESISSVMNSPDFRKELNQAITTCILHCEKNKISGEAAMFEDFKDLLESSLKEIKKKIDEK